MKDVDEKLKKSVASIKASGLEAIPTVVRFGLHMVGGDDAPTSRVPGTLGALGHTKQTADTRTQPPPSALPTPQLPPLLGITPSQERPSLPFFQQLRMQIASHPLLFVYDGRRLPFSYDAL